MHTVAPTPDPWELCHNVVAEELLVCWHEGRSGNGTLPESTSGSDALSAALRPGVTSSIVTVVSSCNSGRQTRTQTHTRIRQQLSKCAPTLEDEKARILVVANGWDHERERDGKAAHTFPPERPASTVTPFTLVDALRSAATASPFFLPFTVSVCDARRRRRVHRVSRATRTTSATTDTTTTDTSAAVYDEVEQEDDRADLLSSARQTHADLADHALCLGREIPTSAGTASRARRLLFGWAQRESAWSCVCTVLENVGVSKLLVVIRDTTSWETCARRVGTAADARVMRPAVDTCSHVRGHHGPGGTSVWSRRYVRVSGETYHTGVRLHGVRALVVILEPARQDICAAQDIPPPHSTDVTLIGHGALGCVWGCAGAQTTAQAGTYS